MSASTSSPASLERLIRGRHDFGTVTESVLAQPLQGVRWKWLIAFGIGGTLTLIMLVSIAWLLIRGVGVWGVNIPVAWGLAIVNFVWWIGIGHAGTLISAILLLLRQEWRNSINRFAEAMTLFAVANAGLFPLLHLGRVWRFYYLFPYPDTMGVWPQWRSPLVWDVIAVLTYGTVSLLFWYVGLLPDLAALRDRARSRWGARLAAICALGWRGDARHWQRHQMLYLLMAGLATPLVVSVHSIVSFDFAVSIVPGWHTTVYPPYFVAGAIYSGFAMVITLAVPLRRALGFQDFITLRHFDAMGKVMLASGLVLLYGYAMEIFSALVSPDRFEHFIVLNRALGPYAPVFWITLGCNFVIGQLLWFRRVRTNLMLFFILSLFVNLGMWSERFVIVIISLHRDFLPSSWGMYWPTIWDWSLLLGSLGFFSLLMMLFARFVPAMSIYELRETLRHERSQEAAGEPEPSTTEAAASGAQTAIAGQCVDGVAGEFRSPEQVTAAAEAARAAGLSQVEAYVPMPIHELPPAMGMRPTRIALVVFLGGFGSAAAAYFMQWYAAVLDYPVNVGGRPLHSWPSFVPLTFELGVLGATLSGLVALLVRCGLPRLHHAVFRIPGFRRASRDRFFLFVRTDRGAVSPGLAARWLHEQGAARVCVLPRMEER